jgi:hypothetical protein
MAGTGQIGLLWTVRACWIPAGVQQQNVPAAQSLAQNNDFGANSGLVIVPGTIGSMSAANITTALTTLGANAALAFGGTGASADGTANLGVINGWANGFG